MTKITLLVLNTKSPEFYSSDLVGTTLKGACILPVCGDSDLRLATGKWIKVDTRSKEVKEWVEGYSACPDVTSVKEISLQGLIGYLLKLQTDEELFRLCTEAKEKILTNVPISSIDLGHIAPMNPVAGPVYRLNGLQIETSLWISTVAGCTISTRIRSKFNWLWCKYKQELSLAVLDPHRGSDPGGAQWNGFSG